MFLMRLVGLIARRCSFKWGCVIISTMKKALWRIAILILSLLILILPDFGKAFPGSSNFSYLIQSHHLRVKIDPAKHLIQGEDRLTVLIKGKNSRVLSFLLHPALRIISVTNVKTRKALHWSEAPLSSFARKIDVSLDEAGKSVSLSVSYEGSIYDPIAKEKALQFVRGDQTSGIIGPEGVYLSRSSHWYPDWPDSMATFDLEATIPDPFRVVSQGELVSDKVDKGLRKTRWVYDLPTEGLTLVAGRYSVGTRIADGVKISTYFFPEDDRFSEIFLNAAEEYLKIYSGLLGRYPFKKFDIVQNFFSSGYGIPTFTLLAPETIRQGKEFLKPGALDHEIVHSWWGHYVSSKPEGGNWVEALTTYCTNYYYRELKIDEESARKYRQDALQKYAIQVPSSGDYPLRQFEEKRNELDGQIGYGKGSMVFHMLRQIVGKDLFFSTLRRFSKRYGGHQADWRDIEKIFEEASGKRLDRFFSQWLDRSGGPLLKLENVRYEVEPGGYRVLGEVVQEGDAYELQLPVVVESASGKKSLLLEISQKKSPISVEVPGPPLKLNLDPDSHLFRKLRAEEVIPCLNALLEDREKIFVLPDRRDEESRRIYAELATTAKEGKGGQILSLKEVTREKIVNSSLMLLGESWKDPLFSELFRGLTPPLRFEEGAVWVDGKKVSEGDESLLFTYPHPLRPGKWVTIYFGSSPAGLARARFIFFYGWDSYVLFKGGRPLKRETLQTSHPYVSHDLLPQSHLHRIEPQRLKGHVSDLASPQMAGRFPGTPGYRKAQEYLINHIEGMGIVPIFQPFTIAVRDIEKANLVVKTSEDDKPLRAIPLCFSKEGDWKGPVLFVDDEEIEKMESLSGKGAMLYLKSSGIPADQSLFRRIKELQLKEAEAIVFFIEQADLDRLTSYIIYPSYIPPKLRDRLETREKEGYFFHPLMEAAKEEARRQPLESEIKIPVLLVPILQAERGWVKELINRRDVSAEMAISFKEDRFKDLNIGGIIPGQDPEKKKEFLVLGAHYDHLGKDEKRGGYYSGADDNASGVSALLEIVRSLAEKKTEFRRSLVFIFFGGEEWGAWGSGQFVRNPFVPLSQIKAMFSIDSIGGRTNEREVFFVGNSFYPDLARRSRKFLQQVQLKEGRDIDRFAFAFGSDHYPFHQMGIPSLNYFASDYRTLHTFQDQPEAVDFEKLTDVTKLIYLTAYEFLTEPF